MLKFIRLPASSHRETGTAGWRLDRAAAGSADRTEASLGVTLRGDSYDRHNPPSRNAEDPYTSAEHEDNLLAVPFLFVLLTSSLLWRAILITARSVYSIIVRFH